MSLYVFGLFVVAMLLLLGGASAPLAAAAAGLAWLKGARREARWALLAAGCLLGTWTPYVLLALLDLPLIVLWWIPVAAVGGNAVAASVGAHLRGAGPSGPIGYAVGLVVGLGPPVLALELDPSGIGDLSLPAQVWGLLGVAWTLFAGVVALWVGVLSLPSPSADWSDG